MAEVSEVLSALYRGDREAASRLADGRPLDVFEAAALGDETRVRELLAADPDLARAWAGDGFTALHLSCFFPAEPGAAAALLEAGADPNAPARNEMAVPPLSSAAASGHRATAALLLEHGADVHAAQRGGYTPLHSAAANGDRQLVEMLLARRAEAGRAADDGRSPATLARERGHPELADELEARMG